MADTIAEQIAQYEQSDPAFAVRLKDFFAVLKTLLPEGLQNLKVIVGESAFVTTATTKEVPAVDPETGEIITTAKFAVAFPKAAQANTELMFMDGVIDGSPKTTTVTRAAGTTSGLGFWYILIGT